MSKQQDWALQKKRMTEICFLSKVSHSGKFMQEIGLQSAHCCKVSFIHLCIVSGGKVNDGVKGMDCLCQARVFALVFDMVKCGATHFLICCIHLVSLQVAFCNFCLLIWSSCSISERSLSSCCALQLICQCITVDISMSFCAAVSMCKTWSQFTGIALNGNPTNWWP